MANKKQTRLFLSELRGGSDLETAACVADISLPEAERLAATERRGGFRHEIVEPPAIIVRGNALSIALGGGFSRFDVECDLSADRSAKD